MQCLTPEFAEVVATDRIKLTQDQLALSQKEAMLTALEDRLNQQLDQIELAKSNLDAEFDRLNGVAEADLDHLVQMYATMKPKKAAEIFDKMDPAFAAGFLREMDGNRAGLILSEMNVNQSYRISVLIANRNMNWR